MDAQKRDGDKEEVMKSGKEEKEKKHEDVDEQEESTARHCALLITGTLKLLS